MSSTARPFPYCHKRPGFTLFELLIYVGILSTVVTGVILMVGEMFKIQAKVRGSFVLRDNLDFVQQRLKYSVQNAADVTLPATGTGALLRVAQTTTTGDTADFTLASSYVTMSVKGESPVNLTSPEVSITSLTFERLQGSPPTIKYTLAGRLRNAEPFLQISDQVTGFVKINR